MSCKTETSGLVGRWMDHLNVRRGDNPQSNLLVLDSVKGKGHIPVPQLEHPERSVKRPEGNFVRRSSLSTHLTGYFSSIHAQESCS